MLTLFYRPTCPYCRKVRNAALEFGIGFDLRDIAQEANRTELISQGGKQQVPYLVDVAKGVAMYESEDIIAYLQKEYASAHVP